MQYTKLQLGCMLLSKNTLLKVEISFLTHLVSLILMSSDRLLMRWQDIIMKNIMVRDIRMD